MQNRSITPQKVALRCHLNIVFSDITNSTRIAAGLEPEAYSELLDKLRSLTEAIVTKHGGQVIRIDGDGVIFIFGYPDAFEDGGRRATAAAIELHQAVNAADQLVAVPAARVGLHTGIHSGTVLLKSGDITRGRYEILGNATNIASRLCAFAGHDEIIVSDQALGRDKNFFRTGNMHRIKIQGHDNNFLVHSVVQSKDTPNRFAARSLSGLSPFCGRQEELKKMQTAFRQAGHNGGVAIIKGAAGLGKTRFVSEFLSDVTRNGGITHQGYCESYLSAEPLQPVLQILRSIFKSNYGLASKADAPAIRQFLTEYFPNSADVLMRLLSKEARPGPSDIRQIDGILSALSEVLDGAATEKPITIFIDDWQWSDDATRHIVSGLKDHLKSKIFLILATRDISAVDVKSMKSIVVNINPLDDQSAAQAIGSQLSAPEPFLIDKILQQAGGSPLFIEELCHAAQNTPGLQAGSGGPEGLIHARFSSVPGHQATLIRIAAVIGHMIPAWLFLDITGIGQNHQDFMALTESDFIYRAEVSGVLKFKHGIVRDVIYGAVGLHERRAIHGRIVDALHRRARDRGEDENLDSLAYHYACMQDSANAYKYSILAGDKALSVSALDRAQGHYNQAFSYFGDLRHAENAKNSLSSLITKFGLSSIVDPAWEQTLTLRRVAKMASDQNDALAHTAAQYWLGFVMYGLGEPKQSLDHLTQSLILNEPIKSAKMTRALNANLGQAYAAACDYQNALKYIDPIISKAQERQPSKTDKIGLSYTIACKAFLLADQGHFNESQALFEKAERLLDGQQHHVSLSVINLRSAAAIWQGDFGKAQLHARTVLDMNKGMKSRYHDAMARALTAVAKIYADADLSTLNTLETMTQWMTESSTQQFVSLNYGFLTDIYMHTERVADSRRYAALTLRRARKGDRLGEAMAYRALARLAAPQCMKKARRYLDRAFRSAEARQSPRETYLTDLCAAKIMKEGGMAKEAVVAEASARAHLSNLNMREDAFSRRQEV